MSKQLKFSGWTLGLGMLVAGAAQAGDTGLDILVRGKAGIGIWGNVTHSSAFTYGFDMGTVFWSGFGITVSVATGAASSPDLRLTSFSATPNYTIRKDGVAIYFGPSFGALTSGSADVALGAAAGLDIPITEHVFFAVSGQYLASLGTSPAPSVLSFLGGLGYRF